MENDANALAVAEKRFGLGRGCRDFVCITLRTGARFALIPPDNASGNFTKVVQRVPVRIELLDGCGEDQPLRPGMSVEAAVHTRGS